MLAAEGAALPVARSRARAPAGTGAAGPHLMPCRSRKNASGSGSTTLSSALEGAVSGSCLRLRPAAAGPGQANSSASAIHTMDQVPAMWQAARCSQRRAT